ncbi:ANTAR domain-containing protein [Kribbella swartbergensis]
MEQPDLVAVMARVADSLRYPIDIAQTLEEITAGAVAAVPGIDHASLSITGRDGKIQTLAPTDEVAVQLDALQYELSEGPCLEAVLAEPLVQVDDISNDLRWPSYGPRAVKEFGIRSQLAFQFRADPHVRGGVNLYSKHPYRITVETRQLGVLFANLAAAALGWSRQDETLNEAVHTRHLIGQAIGITMERYQIDPNRAFGFMVRISQTSNTKLHEIAADIVADVIAKAP